MHINEIKKFLKSKNFTGYQAKSKTILEGLMDDFKVKGIIPVEYKRLKLLKQYCETNKECRSKTCIDNKCVSSSKNEDNTNKLKPLIFKNKLELNKNIENNCTTNLNIELKSHQKRVIDFLKNTKRKGLLLVHSVGSGKTITSVIAAKCILSKYRNKTVVVLTPSSVQQQFSLEITKLGLTEEMLSRFDVFSHQMWLDRYNEGHFTNLKNTVIIVDETHKFKGKFVEKSTGNKGIYSNLLADAALESFKIILLSATPIENDILEISNYLAMLNGKTLLDEYQSNDIETTKNKTILEKDYSDILKCKTSFFQNTDTKEDYPMTIYEDKKIQMTKAYQRKYEQVENVLFESEQLANIFKKNDKHDLKNINKFYSGIRRSVNNIDVISPKIKWIKNKIKKCLTDDEKILIYSTWLENGVNLLQKYMSDSNIPYYIIEGSTSNTNRFAIVKNFNDNKKKILLITSAGAEGLDLKGTKHVILMEPFWHKSRNKQVIGRAVRYKSHSHLPENEQFVKIYNLILTKNPKYTIGEDVTTADTLLFEMSKTKESITDQFMNQIKQNSIEFNDC
jgi:SNF2 family DNA or RNA helicase